MARARRKGDEMDFKGLLFVDDNNELRECLGARRDSSDETILYYRDPDTAELRGIDIDYCTLFLPEDRDAALRLIAGYKDDDGGGDDGGEPATGDGTGLTGEAA